MLIFVFCQILLIIGDYILLVRFELGDDLLDITGVDAKISRYQYDEEFILNVNNIPKKTGY